MAVKLRNQDKLVVEMVRKKLIDRKGHWKSLPPKRGRGITYRWVAAFAAGEIKDPAYTRLAALGRCLDIDIGVMPTKVNGDGGGGV